MRRKRKKPLPRGKLRDNSKSISVRMTEEQFQRLERYRELTRLPVTTYFRKLIAESEIVKDPAGSGFGSTRKSTRSTPISARFCGIPAQRNWTGRRRTESVSCWNTFSNRPTT